MNQIVDTINVGIRAAEKFINAPFAWQVHPMKRSLCFLFPGRQFHIARIIVWFCIYSILADQRGKSTPGCTKPCTRYFIQKMTNGLARND